MNTIRKFRILDTPKLKQKLNTNFRLGHNNMIRCYNYNNMKLLCINTNISGWKNYVYYDIYEDELTLDKKNSNILEKDIDIINIELVKEFGEIV